MWRQVFEAADQVLDLDPADREVFLARWVQEHPALGGELVALLDAASAVSVLESPASVFSAPFLEVTAEGEDAIVTGDSPSMFGPYRVRHEVGRGGMAAVYLAERSDDQYHKDVALKVLPAWGGGGRQRRQRFLEERQILAALDHPSIARLLDGGVTEDGVPWFAMEYIDGQPIDRYADELRLSVDDRLSLFCKVCAAVQYAHRHLVVHRDLKPSNILVSAEGRVALLDFGIARLLAEDPAQTAASTATGDRLLTPLYASPEQIRGEPASTAEDVYALGVLLHLLLTGRSPYRLASFEGYAVAGAVLEQTPEPPSYAVLRPDSATPRGPGEAPDERARVRDSTAVKLARRLRGDLDAMVLKALEKEPGRRYATVEQFETDVRRHLDRLPVLAQPASRLYIARQFGRRHGVGVGLTAAVALLVLIFAVVMTVQRSRIRAQAQRISVERDRAEQTEGLFLRTFEAVTPGVRGTSAREILDSATARIDQELADHPGHRADLMMTMARAYHRLELYAPARTLLERSLGLRRGLRPGAPVQIAETLVLLGAVLLAQGEVEPAERVLSEALALRRQALGDGRGEVARTLVDLSAVRRAQRRLPDAERLAREAIRIDQSRGDVARVDLAQSTSALAHVLADQGDHRSAAALYRQALSLARAVHSDEHPDVVDAVFDLASALHASDGHREADSLTRYGIAVQRRLLTGVLLRGAAQLEGTTDLPRPTPAGGSEEIAASVGRVLEGKIPTPGPPASRTPGARIAFVSDRDGPDPVGNRGNHEVYVMNADGTDQRRLTHHKNNDFNPAWSPDGKRIAFTSQRDGGFDIFLMNADGSEQRVLTRFTALGLGAVEPTWSPDGKRIAFRSRVKDEDIYVINADGTGLTRLTRESGGSVAPAWSPDGKRIVFSSRRHGRPEIFTMDADGGNQVRLTTNDAVDNRPAWSPDGRYIAFHSNRDGDLEIYVMNADGSDQVRLTTYPGEDAHPSWSPDGRQIVFHRRVLGHGQVFVMNADGTDVKRITGLSAVAFSGFPSWGPAPP